MRRHSRDLGAGVTLVGSEAAGHGVLVSALRKVRWAADQADKVVGVADTTVAAVVALHGASVPWGLLQADGVTVVPARRVPDLL